MELKKQKENCDVILIDTAGRLAIDNEMMANIENSFKSQTR